jgi:zinc D-Ala-D-Ala carboxypeptidase
MTLDAYSGSFDERYLTASQTAARLGLSNVLPLVLRPNLIRLSRYLCEIEAALLLRHVGRLTVSSAYRGTAVNDAVNGAKNSMHVMALAADINFTGMSSFDLANFIVALTPAYYDQVINEFGQWVHVGLAQEGSDPRRQTLTANKRRTTDGKLKTVYTFGITKA